MIEAHRVHKNLTLASSIKYLAIPRISIPYAHQNFQHKQKLDLEATWESCSWILLLKPSTGSFLASMVLCQTPLLAMPTRVDRQP